MLSRYHTPGKAKYEYKYPLTTRPKIIVENAPPIKPSHVFFGESLIKGVLPKKNPNM